LPSILASPTLTVPPSWTPTLSPSASLTATPSQTSLPSPTGCPIPPGWVPYTVQRGETLNPLAARFGIDPQELADANCITRSQQVVPGLVLYVPEPDTAPPYASPIPCAPPSGWVIYIVQPGDTLYNLALRLNLTAYQLQLANCLPSSYLYAGQRLFVPFYPAPLPTSPWPTRIPTTPIPTDTAIPTDTDIPTDLPPTEPPPTDDYSSGSTPPASSPP
jgi:LysM repeat protein